MMTGICLHRPVWKHRALTECPLSALQCPAFVVELTVAAEVTLTITAQFLVAVLAAGTTAILAESHTTVVAFASTFDTDEGLALGADLVGALYVEDDLPQLAVV